MAGEWREVAIEELAEIFDGPHATPPKTSDGPVFLGISNLARGRLDLANTEHLSEEDYARWTRRVEPQPGDVVFSYETRLGEAALIPSGLRCCLGRRMGLLRARAGKVDKRFLLYAYLGPRFQETLRSRTIHGSTVDRIPLIDMPSFPIEVPEDIDEQRAIAHILGTLDDKIELNRRMNETLEAMARALFKSWFVDFDPVRAKAEGRDPGLPKPLADLFPARLVDSELGEIPEGWEVKRLSDLCSTQYGYTASAVDEPVGPRFLRVTDINKRNWIEWSDVPYCAIDPDIRASYALQLGDLVVARMADPGKSAIIEEEIDAVFASYLVRLKTASLAHSYYVYGFLKSDLYAEYAEGAQSGSVQANMNAKVIVGASLVVPPIAVMEQFLRAVLPLRQRLVADVRESRTLAALRDGLLPKLISGELRVNDTERFIGRAL
jgi:type I restriction enzyme S subunit